MVYFYYIYIFEPKTILRKEYKPKKINIKTDRYKNNTNKSAQIKNILNGNFWCRKDGIKTVNQTIRRLIRKKKNG